MINLVPFKQSDSSLCGPAVIKAILYYYGIDALESEIARRCNHTYDLGCTDLQMKEAIESYGLAVKIYNNSSIEDLEYWMQHHIPVIVDWFSAGSISSLEDTPNGHASVVVEIDKEKVYILDPEIGQVRGIRHDDFMRVWFDWRIDPHLKTWDSMVLRQAMVVFPKRLLE